MTQAGSFQHVSAGGMSLLVHSLFIGFLLLGVSWRSLPHLPVEAELWSELPDPPATLMSETLPELPPEPLPPLPQPEVSKSETPKQEVAKPDIALERAEKKLREKDARELAALQRLEAARQMELQRQTDENMRLEKEKIRIEKEKTAQMERIRLEQSQRELVRREMEQELSRQAREELDAEEAQLRATQLRQQSKDRRQAQLVNEFRGRIQRKIQGYVRDLGIVSGNPEVVFKVTLLPNGEVVRAILERSSGQPAYDQEMERAILKASPLPLPDDRDAARVFRDGLILKFRPHADASGGG